jgi:hypothetical protein
MTATLADDGRDFLIESLRAGRASATTWRTEADGLDAELNIIESALLGDEGTAAPAPCAQTVMITYEVGACGRCGTPIDRQVWDGGIGEWYHRASQLRSCA